MNEKQHHRPEDLAIYPFEQPSPSRTLVDILQASTSAHPRAIAIDNGTSRLSYAELSAQIALRVKDLRAVGIRRGDRVGVRISSGTIELYVGILAILTAGAAYVPVDVDDPDERANLVWEEAGVCAVMTDNQTLTRHGMNSGIAEDSSDESDNNNNSSADASTNSGSTNSSTNNSSSNSSITQQDDDEEDGALAGLPLLEDDAWIIFTSGSTGKPKGVAVSHRAAAAFVDAESSLFLPQDKQLCPGDRVLAGLSVAFDASCEEMWLAWRYGACLVPAPRSLVKAGADLGTFLTAQRITVVSTVPTLAALWPAEALSALRLLILGGEACSAELATRLARAVKTGVVWNTYGPTEATVVSCAAPLLEGESVVRIGLPLRGWKLAVVGDDGKPVRWGEDGELVIGGVGMARYLDLEKDKVKFSPAPVFDGERAYRSGDLVRAEKDGLLFIGRNDEQIKLGGRRIELGEIDAALMTLPGVTAAASAIRRSEMGLQVLVGYVVREVDEKPKVQTVSERELLRRVLPATLIPMLVTVDELPVRTSGKVDRKALPWPPPASASNIDAQFLDGTTAWLVDLWRKVLGVPASPDSHFFELGGTSLGAAQLVSQIRQRCPTISVADVYENPRLEDMAGRIDDLSGTTHDDRNVDPTPRWVILIQCVVLFAELTFEGIRWLTALSVAKKFFALALGPNSWAGQAALPWWLVAVLWALFISFPGRLLTTASVLRLLTAGMRPGSYARGGPVHLRLWAAERFVGLGRVGSVAGTQWCRYYGWLLGCQIGKGAQLHSLPPTTGLASFGAASVIEPEADVAGWWLDGDVLHIGSITIGEGARVGARSTLMPDTVLEAYSNVQPGTSVQGTVRGPDTTPSADEKSVAENKETFWTGFRYTTSLLLLDFLPIILVAPIWGLTPILVHDYSDFRLLILTMIEMSLPGAVLGTFLYAALIISMVRLASIAIRPGKHSWNGTTAWASWLIHGLVMDARSVLFPIYASLFTPSWLRMLGANIGNNVEASTVVPIPSLLRVDDNAFLADDVLLSPYELGAGQIRLGVASVGSKAFVGNSGIVDPGITVPDAALIGVLSTAPHDMEAGSSYLGRPPMSLPRRVDAPVDETRTFKPPKKLVFARAAVESLRIFPLIFSGLLATLVGVGMLWIMDTFGIGWAILSGGGLLTAAGIAACLITIFAKWLLTPVIRSGDQHPLWSSFVWRNELADTFIQSLAVPWLARLCYGTPMLSMFLRCLGAKIGRGVWLESHLLPEAELITLESGSAVNRGCVLQTHLFHDRLMRLDTVHLERGATLGPYAITLPGTTIGAGTTIAPTSLVMRGEKIPPNTRWMGNPVRPWKEEKLQSSSSSSSLDRDASSSV